jgi:hypothetical protein
LQPGLQQYTTTGIPGDPCGGAARDLAGWQVNGADRAALAPSHLKGATLNSHQLAELAPLFARHLGIVIDE